MTEPSPDLEVLLRWEASDATWDLVSLRPDGVELRLLSCDAGTEVDRLSSSQDDLRRYVTARDPLTD